MIKKIGMVKRITHVKRRLCVLVSDNVEYFFRSCNSSFIAIQVLFFRVSI